MGVEVVEWINPVNTNTVYKQQGSGADIQTGQWSFPNDVGS
jgi:hypothetical protein